MQHLCACLMGFNKFNKSVWTCVSKIEPVTDSPVLLREVWPQQHKQNRPKPTLNIIADPWFGMYLIEYCMSWFCLIISASNQISVGSFSSLFAGILDFHLCTSREHTHSLLWLFSCMLSRRIHTRTVRPNHSKLILLLLIVFIQFSNRTVIKCSYNRGSFQC